MTIMLGLTLFENRVLRRKFWVYKCKVMILEVKINLMMCTPYAVVLI